MLTKREILIIKTMKLKFLIINKIAKLFLYILNLGIFSLGITSSFAQIQNNTVLHIGDNCSMFIESDNFMFDSSIGQTSTTRTPTNYGKLIFSSTASANGSSSNHFLNGYARIQSTSPLLFPVGQSGVYAPVNVAPSSINPIDVAYYRSNPSTIGNTLDIGVPLISSLEYWNIQGDNNAMISLTWSASSNLNSIASSTIELFIVGYDGAKWVKIPSLVDATSILGGSSSLTSGSLSTLATVNLNNYKYFSIGADAALSTFQFDLNGYKVYTRDSELRILSYDEMTNVEVFDLTGKVVFESKILNMNEFVTPFNVSSGIYLVRVKFSDDRIVIKKLIN